MLTLAIQVQSVAVGWRIYELTGDVGDLGWVGLAHFLPVALLSLPGGQVADHFHKGRVLSVALLGVLASSLFLAIGAEAGWGTWSIYAATVVFGAARAFSGPAATSMLPQIVPPNVFTRAVAVNSSTWQVATIIGPAVGGLLYAYVGAAGAFLTTATGLCLAIVLISSLKLRPIATPPRGASLQQVLEGLRFVAATPVLVAIMSLDLFAVLLGGATALLPVFASDIYHIGPKGLGLLRSGPAIGAAATALLLARFPVRRHAGWTMFGAVATFGCATVAFGSSTNLVTALVSLVVMGAADEVSVVIRQTLLQLYSPPEMRGRISAVNLVFVGASNELGEFESGMSAKYLGPVRAVWVGGLGTLAVVMTWAAAFPSLRRIDTLDAPKKLADTAAGGSG